MRTKTGEINLFKLFVILTTIPTILAFFYYYLYASDIYVSETQFSLYDNSPQITPLALGDITGLATKSMNTDDQEQLIIVSEYIKNFEMLKKLDEALDLRKLYSNPDIDIISRLSPDATNKDFINYYNGIVDLEVNREANTISLSIKSFDKDTSQKVAIKINELVEEFINDLLSRVKEESLNSAKGFIEKAENKIKDIQSKLSEFRINNKTLDPLAELDYKIEFIKGLETRKAELLVEKNEKKSFLGSTSIPLTSLKTKIANINELILDSENDILNFADKDGDLLREYSILRLDEEFAKEEYKLALVNLEQTMKDYTSKNKYLVEILKPTAPDVATEPKRFIEVLKVFAASVIFFGILGLMVSGIRDHMI